jgi:hypothetical protein
MIGGTTWHNFTSLKHARWTTLPRDMQDTFSMWIIPNLQRRMGYCVHIPLRVQAAVLEEGQAARA